MTRPSHLVLHCLQKVYGLVCRDKKFYRSELQWDRSGYNNSSSFRNIMRHLLCSSWANFHKTHAVPSVENRFLLKGVPLFINTPK